MSLCTIFFLGQQFFSNNFFPKLLRVQTNFDLNLTTKILAWYMNSTNAVFVWLCGQSSRNTKSSINDKNENIATLTHPLYSPSWLQQWVQAFFIASVLFRSSRRIKRKKLLWCAVPSLAQLKVALSLQLTYLTNIFCNKTCRIINTSGIPQTWQKNCTKLQNSNRCHSIFGSKFFKIAKSWTSPQRNRIFLKFLNCSLEDNWPPKRFGKNPSTQRRAHFSKFWEVLN